MLSRFLLDMVLEGLCLLKKMHERFILRVAAWVIFGDLFSSGGVRVLFIARPPDLIKIALSSGIRGNMSKCEIGPLELTDNISLKN